MNERRREYSLRSLARSLWFWIFQTKRPFCASFFFLVLTNCALVLSVAADERYRAQLLATTGHHQAEGRCWWRKRNKSKSERRATSLGADKRARHLAGAQVPLSSGPIFVRSPQSSLLHPAPQLHESMASRVVQQPGENDQTATRGRQSNHLDHRKPLGWAATSRRLLFCTSPPSRFQQERIIDLQRQFKLSHRQALKCPPVA